MTTYSQHMRWVRWILDPQPPSCLLIPAPAPAVRPSTHGHHHPANPALKTGPTSFAGLIPGNTGGQQAAAASGGQQRMPRAAPMPPPPQPPRPQTQRINVYGTNLQLESADSLDAAAAGLHKWVSNLAAVLPSGVDLDPEPLVPLSQCGPPPPPLLLAPEPLRATAPAAAKRCSNCSGSNGGHAWLTHPRDTTLLLCTDCHMYQHRHRGAPRPRELWQQAQVLPSSAGGPAAPALAPASQQMPPPAAPQQQGKLLQAAAVRPVQRSPPQQQQQAVAVERRAKRPRMEVGEGRPTLSGSPTGDDASAVTTKSDSPFAALDVQRAGRVEAKSREQGKGKARATRQHQQQPRSRPSPQQQQQRRQQQQQQAQPLKTQAITLSVKLPVAASLPEDPEVAAFGTRLAAMGATASCPLLSPLPADWATAVAAVLPLPAASRLGPGQVQPQDLPPQQREQLEPLTQELTLLSPLPSTWGAAVLGGKQQQQQQAAGAKPRNGSQEQHCSQAAAGVPAAMLEQSTAALPEQAVPQELPAPAFAVAAQLDEACVQAGADLGALAAAQQHCAAAMQVQQVQPSPESPASPPATAASSGSPAGAGSGRGVLSDVAAPLHAALEAASVALEPASRVNAIKVRAQGRAAGAR